MECLGNRTGELGREKEHASSRSFSGDFLMSASFFSSSERATIIVVSFRRRELETEVAVRGKCFRSAFARVASE